jgi:hypothetical protein
VLTQKFFKIYWRSPNYNFVRFLMTLMIAIILGLVYLGEVSLDTLVCGGILESCLRRSADAVTVCRVA